MGKAKVGSLDGEFTSSKITEYFVSVGNIYLGKDLKIYHKMDLHGFGDGGVYFNTEKEAQALADRYNGVDTPKLWKDMTPEEKGALLLANLENQIIEWYDTLVGVWHIEELYDWDPSLSYRVKPKPVEEELHLYFDKYGRTTSSNADWVVTVTFVDGVPNPTALVEGM